MSRKRKDGQKKRITNVTTQQQANQCARVDTNDTAKKLDPDNRDGIKEAFSQACQMYRHFVTMKYYTIAGFGVATAAFATLFFGQLPNSPNAKSAALCIKVVATIVAFACGVYDWRITNLMYHYQGLMRTFAVALRVTEFSPHPSASEWMWPLRIATVLIFGGVGVAWIFFADVPSNSHSP